MSSIAAEIPVWRPKINPWIIGVAVSLAAFTEVLDTSLANVALRHIAGGLGGSNDGSTMVQAQSATLSYVDAYWQLALFSAIMFFGSFVLKRNEPGKGESVSVR